MTAITPLTFHRRTKETDIELSLNLMGSGQMIGTTSQGFMDHMLTALCFYSQVDMTLTMTGDYHVDQHHSFEDLGIALGHLLKMAIDVYQPVARFGECHGLMDDALVRCVLDLSGRPYLYWGLPDLGERIGTFETEVLREFFVALTNHSGISLHVDWIRGTNRHHIVEGVFKAFARAFFDAKQPLTSGQLKSTKGLID